jgi:hypothetical protein
MEYQCESLDNSANATQNIISKKNKSLKNNIELSNLSMIKENQKMQEISKLLGKRNKQVQDQYEQLLNNKMKEEEGDAAPISDKIMAPKMMVSDMGGTSHLHEDSNDEKPSEGCSQTKSVKKRNKPGKVNQ